MPDVGKVTSEVFLEERIERRWLCFSYPFLVSDMEIIFSQTTWVPMEAHQMRRKQEMLRLWSFATPQPHRATGQQEEPGTG